MYHSDLRKEISYLQASLAYKRGKLGKALEQGVPLKELKGLHDEIREIEQKLQTCFEESRTQMEDGQSHY